MFRIVPATALAVGLTVVASAEASAQQDRRGFATERLNRFINQRSIVVEPQGNGAGEAQQPDRRNPAARIAINPGGEQSSNEGDGRRPSLIAQPPGNGGNANGEGQGAPQQDPPRQQIVIAPQSNEPLGRQDQPVRVPQERQQQVVIPPQRPPLDEEPVFQQQPERQDRPLVVTPDRPIIVNPPVDEPQQAAEPRFEQQRPFVATPSDDPLDHVAPPDDEQTPLGAPPPVDAPADLAARPGEAAPDGSVLEAWQVQFRLGNAGYHDVRFVDRDEAYYYVIATTRGDHPTDYAMAVDIYTGDITAQQEVAYYAQAPQYDAPQYHVPDYQPPQYDRPRYDFRFQQPHYQEPQYQAPDYDPPQYQQPEYQAPNNGYRRY